MGSIYVLIFLIEYASGPVEWRSGQSLLHSTPTPTQPITEEVTSGSGLTTRHPEERALAAPGALGDPWRVGGGRELRGGPPRVGTPDAWEPHELRGWAWGE